MLGVGRARKRQDPDRAGEAENNLRGSAAGAGRQILDFRMIQHFGVCSEKRKTLIHDFSLHAKKPHLAIPTQARETAVLHKCWRLSVSGNHLLEMPQRNVTHAEETRAAGIALHHHRCPNLAISLGPTVSRSWTMQNVAVHEVGPKMLKRTSHRLR